MSAPWMALPTGGALRTCLESCSVKLTCTSRLLVLVADVVACALEVGLQRPAEAEDLLDRIFAPLGGSFRHWLGVHRRAEACHLSEGLRGEALVDDEAPPQRVFCPLLRTSREVAWSHALQMGSRVRGRIGRGGARNAMQRSAPMELRVGLLRKVLHGWCSCAARVVSRRPAARGS